MSDDQLSQAARSPNSSIEQCSICMENFTDQVVGIPEHCEHLFCFHCLVDWTKKSNSCPIDRHTFQHIFKKRSLSSLKPYSKININNDQFEIDLEDNFISCQACGCDDQESPLLICDGCNDGYRIICLNSFDMSTWNCPSCGYDHTKESHAEPLHTPVIVRQPSVGIRTGGLDNESITVRIGRLRRRLQRRALRNVTRRIEIVNPITRNQLLSTTTRRATIRAFEELLNDNDAITLTSKSPTRSVITPSEAARQIAASGVPILARAQSVPIINQVLHTPMVNRKRTVRRRPAPPRIPVHQLPRIQRLANAPPRPRPKKVIQKPNPVGPSFIDKLLNAQRALCSLQNVRMHGPHIKLS